MRRPRRPLQPHPSKACGSCSVLSGVLYSGDRGGSVDDRQILAVVESKRAAALAAHHFVHEHPELSHEERDCSRYLCDVLEGAGLEVERGVAGMETAFRATLRGPRPAR